MVTSTNIVLETLSLVSKDHALQVQDGSIRLIGSDGLLDSMKLVELCLALEDRADALGFQFDWTSDKAMSEHAGMFRTVESLAVEFDRQWRMAGSPGSSDGAGG